MQNVFWDEHTMRQQLRVPSVLAIGDSWFWYPFPGGSLLTHLGPLLDDKGHTVFALGNNGAEAVDYLNGKYKNAVKNALRLYGDSSLSAVFLSGGGNDFAGINDLLPLLHGDNSGAASARECFLEGADWPSLGWLLLQMYASYASLIGRIFTTCTNASVILHNYDYAFPDGRGVFGPGGWMKPALDRTKVPVELHRECVKYVIDQFSDMLEILVRSGGGRIQLVDGRGTLRHEHWDNEMHPNGVGFRTLVSEAWAPVLGRNGLA